MINATLAMYPEYSIAVKKRNKTDIWGKKLKTDPTPARIPSTNSP